MASSCLINVIAVVEDRGDSRVVEGRRVLGLRRKPRPEARVVGDLWTQQLDGDVAAQRRIGATPDLPHATTGDPAHQDVATVSDAGHRLITASMTERAIGPARPLPLISPRSTPVCSTMTATAT
jgi:hypothetical protein